MYHYKSILSQANPTVNPGIFELNRLKNDLLSLPSLIDEVLKSEDEIAELAMDFIHERDVFFLG